MRIEARVLLAIAWVLPSLGCAGLEALDRSLAQVIPTHPVTGAPVANVVSEGNEVQRSAAQHAKLEAAVKGRGLSLDPPGAHLNQMVRVLQRLAPIATSHRPGLPWQYWLVPIPEVNAFTTGGGYVYVYDGLWGTRGLIREGDDDELAFVLAHEIAHVNLLHVSLALTQRAFNDRIREDPYFKASFSTEQEAEADRLAVLYATLAGYDARAGARIWDRRGVSEADHAYLNSHPVGADRASRVRAALSQVEDFRIPGHPNPDWRGLLASNPLFPNVAQGSGSAGGLAKAILLGVQTKLEHDAAKDEAERREEAAARLPQIQAKRIQLLAVQSVASPTGQPLIRMQLRNDAIYDVAALGVRVVYLNGATPLAQDPSCGGPATIPKGRTVWLACTQYAVQGATSYRVEITRVDFR